MPCQEMHTKKSHVHVLEQALKRLEKHDKALEKHGTSVGKALKPKIAKQKRARKTTI